MSSSIPRHGVREVGSPTAMSLVRLLPPTGRTKLWRRAFSAKMARLVVPPPKSMRATPSSFSSSVRTASPGGQALENDAVHLQAGPVGALENIIEGGDRPGDDVDLALQAHPVDAHRVLDAILAVDQKVLDQGVDDLPVRGDGHGAGRLDDPVHVRRGHLPVLDGDDALAVDHLGLAAADPGVNRADFAAGHGFGFFHGPADGPHGVFNIDHHPFAQAAGGGGASPGRRCPPAVPALRPPRRKSWWCRCPNQR